MTKGTMKPKTDKDILNEYLVKYEPSDADLLEAFDVSRQMLWSYKTGEARPSVERLANMAQRADWIGDMAREMLSLRGLVVSAPVVLLPEGEMA